MKNKIEEKLDEGMNKSVYVLNSSNDVIFSINNNIVDYESQYNDLINYIDLNNGENNIKKEYKEADLLNALKPKYKKDTFNKENEDNKFSFFGNVPVDFYNRKEFESLGEHTKKYVKVTIDKSKIDEKMKLKIILLNGGSALNTHEQFVPVNNNGKTNGISYEKNHIVEVKGAINEKYNGYSYDIGGMVLNQVKIIKVKEIAKNVFIYKNLLWIEKVMKYWMITNIHLINDLQMK